MNSVMKLCFVFVGACSMILWRFVGDFGVWIFGFWMLILFC